jgi:LAO/AO transport system kinase
MNGESFAWRRKLARELTERAGATAREVLAASISFSGAARRIGITGPPGAGKSSLIALLAKQWSEQASKVGIIAIDPTSPLSGGSLLGDRIRIDEVAANPNLFIRSLPSGSASDGLCPNILGLFDAFEQARFDYVILETVGVGQVSYQAKLLVDTFVLVLVPESGDTIQAMKAGVLEMADIFVVNKADLPASAKLASELRSIAEWRGQSHGWVPPVILTSATKKFGATELADAIEVHGNAVLTNERIADLAIARREYHLRSLVVRQIDEMLASRRVEIQQATLSDSFHMLVAGINNCVSRSSGKRRV